MAPYAGLLIALIVFILLVTIFFFINAGFWNSVRNNQTVGSTITTGVSASDAGLLFALNLIWGIIALIFFIYLIYILVRDWSTLFGNNTNNTNNRVIYATKVNKNSVCELNNAKSTMACPLHKASPPICARSPACPSANRQVLQGL